MTKPERELADSSGVTAQLRREILEGIFNPGERLVELQLTLRYGTGRASIRSALIELDKEGLIVREANRGASVRKIDVAELIELHQARAVLESLVARHAAERASEHEGAELRQIIQQMKILAVQDAPAALAGLLEQLHLRIREISRHRVGSALLENLRNRTAQTRLHAFATPARDSDSLFDHEAIVEAIAQGDADAAERAVRQHLLSLIDRVQRTTDSRTRGK